MRLFLLSLRGAKRRSNLFLKQRLSTKFVILKESLQLNEILFYILRLLRRFAPRNDIQYYFLVSFAR